MDAFLGVRPKLLEVAREVGPTVQVLQANSPFGSQSEAEHSSSPPAKRQRPSSRATRSTRSTPRYTEEQHGDDIIEIPAPSESTPLNLHHEVGFFSTNHLSRRRWPCRLSIMPKTDEDGGHEFSP